MAGLRAGSSLLFWRVIWGGGCSCCVSGGSRQLIISAKTRRISKKLAHCALRITKFKVYQSISVINMRARPPPPPSASIPLQTIDSRFLLRRPVGLRMIHNCSVGLRCWTKGFPSCFACTAQLRTRGRLRLLLLRLLPGLYAFLSDLCMVMSRIEGLDGTIFQV